MSPRVSLIDEYAHALAALESDEFQLEVCARLASVILGFQSVPASPQGDAGLDALSHGGEYGYCCYGPRHDEFKTNKSRETAIITKFTSDLRRLFELDIQGRGLVRKPNIELATILPNGVRFRTIRLIVNWFESHRVIGPIADKVAEYVAASELKYVVPGVSVVILGPTQLANEYAVDEITISRARQRAFIQRVQAAAETVTISDPKDFDHKMKVLHEIVPDQPAAITTLADG